MCMCSMHILLASVERIVFVSVSAFATTAFVVCKSLKRAMLIKLSLINREPDKFLVNQFMMTIVSSHQFYTIKQLNAFW